MSIAAYFEEHNLSNADRKAMLSLIDNVREKLSMLILLSDVNQISLSQLFKDKMALINQLIDVHGYENIMPVNLDGENAGKISRLIDTFESLNDSAEKLMQDIDRIESLLVQESPGIPKDMEMN